MIQIGRFKFGSAVASTLAVLITLSICALVASFHEYGPGSPKSLLSIIVVNEAMALLATLIYGILAHFILAIINHFKK